MKSNINQLALKYRENPDERLFNRIYNDVMTKHNESIREVAKQHRIDEFDVQAGYDDVFIKCLTSFKDNFEHLLNYSLKNKRLELRRTRASRDKYETFITGTTEESDVATLDYLLMKQDRVESGDYSEEYVRNNDLPSIIKSITEKIKDPTTTAIVNEVLADETLGKFRPTAIAKKLNVHHSVVTRKLAQLKKYYDSASFGDHRDYLCG